MSNLEPNPQEAVCGPSTVAVGPTREELAGREVVLGTRGLIVNRTLPNRDRRMVGAWCFVDHFGPADVGTGPGMRVPPHPHTGLQTVTWLIEGEVFHRDSLGNEQRILPGELNLMTAGAAISHSEESPPDHPPVLHGVQLWVALPDRDRRMAPAFEHQSRLPALADAAVTVTVFAGELAGVTSPARHFSPLVGAEIVLDSGADTRLALEPDLEYAALPVAGDVEVDGVPVAPGPLLYLGSGRSDVALRAERPARLLLLGGQPFEERIVMWWNFIERSHEEIVAVRDEWMAGRAFGTIRGYDGDPLPAPPMPTSSLKPRGRHR